MTAIANPTATSPARSASARGALFALLTAALLAAQEPLCGPAAQKFSVAQYLLVNQIALTLAVPFLLVERQSRQDFVAIFKSPSGLKRLLALMVVGLAGLALYNLGLSHARPVVISAILNLSPFWAAMVAWAVSGVAIPAGRFSFAACLLLAFAGAMAVAYSQAEGAGLTDFLRGASWLFAIPVPIFTALSGSLIASWFKDRRDSAAVAAALLFSAALTIPACALYIWAQGEGVQIDWRLVGLMMTGAILASAVGRLFYQFALRATGGDNGFVTMFFLLSPGLAGAYSWALSAFLPELKFSLNPLYFVGLAVTGAALLYFSRKARAGQAKS